MLQQGTNEAGEHERALFIRAGVQPGGRGCIQWHNSHTLLYINNISSLLSDGNPITPVVMIFMFSPELEDFVTLHKSHTRRTLKSRCQNGNKAVLLFHYFTECFDISEV